MFTMEPSLKRAYCMGLDVDLPITTGGGTQWIPEVHDTIPPGYNVCLLWNKRL